MSVSFTADQLTSRAAWFARLALSQTSSRTESAIHAARCALAVKAWMRLTSAPVVVRCIAA